MQEKGDKVKRFKMGKFMEPIVWRKTKYLTVSIDKTTSKDGISKDFGFRDLIGSQGMCENNYITFCICFHT